MKTSDVLSATKTSRLQWRERDERALCEKEKYEATDGAVTYRLSVTIQSAPAPLQPEAYPLFEYTLESTDEGLIERGQGTRLSEELRELFQVVARPSG